MENRIEALEREVTHLQGLQVGTQVPFSNHSAIDGCWQPSTRAISAWVPKWSKTC